MAIIAIIMVSESVDAVCPLCTGVMLCVLITL